MNFTNKSQVIRATIFLLVFLSSRLVFSQEDVPIDTTSNITKTSTTMMAEVLTDLWDQDSDNIYNLNSGYVGIGTNTPTSKLTILGTGWPGGLEIHNTIGYYAKMSPASDGLLIRNFTNTSIAFSFRNYIDSKLVTILSSGNVGIGTISPGAKLDINGTLRTNSTISLVSGSTTYFSLSSGDSYFNGGGLAIGKTTPSSGYKLDVNGKIRANEVVVNTTGADFVFNEEYELKSLNEVERFIKSNQHLPEIPNAQEMQQKGMGLSEINTKLLQKIEELTLYLIEQDKQLESLKLNYLELKESITNKDR